MLRSLADDKLLRRSQADSVRATVPVDRHNQRHLVSLDAYRCVVKHAPKGERAGYIRQSNVLHQFGPVIRCLFRHIDLGAGRHLPHLATEGQCADLRLTHVHDCQHHKVYRIYACRRLLGEILQALIRCLPHHRHNNQFSSHRNLVTYSA